MKVALIHDYLKEYGGAERVLEALSEIWPEAPIYTAFYVEGSEAHRRFKGAKIVPSWVHYIPGFATKLHSPLRFLAPLIWGSFDFSDYDVVISSASWYVTKGFGKREIVRQAFGSEAQSRRVQDDIKRRPIEICYCHNPPRWLYGYKTAVEWQRFWPIKLYGMIVGHFLRQYDFKAAQRVDYFIANSQETASRIKKFYRRDANVIYPPVHLVSSSLASSVQLKNKKLNANTLDAKRSSYYFIVSRIVGSKGLELAIEAANRMGIKLKIAGSSGGYGSTYGKLKQEARHSGERSDSRIHSVNSGQVRSWTSQDDSKNIEFLGFVSDEELVRLYSEAKAFFALATDEDFGITPVEAMACGTPVIAFYGGGYKETVIEGKTGVFFHDSTPESLIEAIKKFEKSSIKPEDCKKQAEKFSKERFKKEIKAFVENIYRETKTG